MEEFTLILSMVTLGLLAGLSPGALLSLTISESLKNGFIAGLKIAIAPIITDIPIIVFSTILYSKALNFNLFYGIISFIGGTFLLYLSYENIKFKLNANTVISQSNDSNSSLLKGVIGNILNPAPYIFWLTIGTPILINGLEVNYVFSVILALTFFFFLIGSKAFVAYGVDRYRLNLNSAIYQSIIRFLGLPIFIYAILFFYKSASYFGIHL